MNDFEAKIKLIEVNTNDAQNAHYQLYSSLLTFNGILLSAFALVLALTPKLPVFLMLCFLIPNLLSISCIIIALYHFRRLSILRLVEATNQMIHDYPELFQNPPSNIENITDKPDMQIKRSKENCREMNEKFIFCFDKFIVILSLVNPLVFFIVLYNSQIH